MGNAQNAVFLFDDQADPVVNSGATLLATVPTAYSTDYPALSVLHRDRYSLFRTPDSALADPMRFKIDLGAAKDISGWGIHNYFPSDASAYPAATVKVYTATDSTYASTTLRDTIAPASFSGVKDRVLAFAATYTARYWAVDFLTGPTPFYLGKIALGTAITALQYDIDMPFSLLQSRSDQIGPGGVIVASYQGPNRREYALAFETLDDTTLAYLTSLENQRRAFGFMDSAGNHMQVMIGNSGQTQGRHRFGAANLWAKSLPLVQLP